MIASCTVVVEKGCKDFGICKGARSFMIFESMKSEIRVDGLHQTLWMSGNRKNVPTMTVGSRYNLHKGDPTHYITVEVVSI